MKKFIFSLVSIAITYYCNAQTILINETTPKSSCANQTINVAFTPQNGATGPYTVELIEEHVRDSPYFCNSTNTNIVYTLSTSANTLNIPISSTWNTYYTYIGSGFCSNNYYSYGVEWQNYSIKVTGTNAVSAEYSINLSNTCTPTLGVAFSPTSICPGKSGNVSWLSVGANANNVFTIELSDQYGSFSAAQNLLTVSNDNADGTKTKAVTMPSNLASGSSYRIKVKSSSPVSEKEYQFTIKPAAECGAIQSPTISTPICSGSSEVVSWINDGSFGTGNVFTVEIDDNSSFSSPETIGSLASQSATTMTVTMPANMISYNYYIRVKASDVAGSEYISPVSSSFSTGITKPSINGSSGFCPNSYMNLNVYTPSPESNFTFTWKRDNVVVNGSNQSTNTSSNEEHFTRTLFEASDAGSYTFQIVRNADGCSLESDPKVISSFSIPAAPSTSPVTVLNGNSATLTATGCTGTIYWYKTQTPSANDLITSGTYNTPEITTQTTYYASCYNNCYSLRTPLIVSVDASNAPAAPILTASENNFCTGSVESPKLTASGCNGIVRWFKKNGDTFYLYETDNAAPYEFVVNSYNSYTYAADCRENNVLSTSKTEFFITVLPIPSAPSISPSSSIINNGSTITLSAYNCVGTVKWYESYSSADVLASTNIFTTPTLVNTVENTTEYVYYYASCTVNGCESNRNSVTLYVVNELLGPSFTYANFNNVVCGGSNKLITAMGCSNGTINWYDAETNGNLLFTGAAFTTPLLNFNNTGSNSYYYFASCTIGSNTSARSYAQVDVIRQPTNPSANQPTIACNTSTTLTATGCNTSSPEYFGVRWFADHTSTSILEDEVSFTTPNLAATTIYYVECWSGYYGACKSVRVPITVTVGCAAPDPPTISANVLSVCAGAGINLTASGCANTVNWSDGGTGASRNNVVFNASLSLTATCNNGQASANSNSLAITVNPNPVLVITNPAAAAPPATVNITTAAVTTGSTLNGGTLSYHTDAAGNVTLSSPPASAINASGTYYIKATTAAGCKDVKPVVVIISDCGTPILLNQTVDDISTGTTLKKTNETIIAKNKITGTASVTYRSNKSITLDPGTAQSPGFKADAGVVFNAEIGGCN